MSTTAERRQSPVLRFDRERAERQDKTQGTLAGAWEAYRATRGWQEVGPKTKHGYRRAMEIAISMMPARPTEFDVDTWLYKLVNDRGLSPVTANCYKRSVEAVLLEVARRPPHDHALHDAFTSSRKLREPPREKRMPPVDAYARALDACETEEERAFVTLACTAGLRVSEILGLRREDLNAHTGVLTVVRQRGRNARKNRTAHQVQLDETTVRTVLAVAQSGTKIHHTQRGLQGKGWLFPWGRPKVGALMDKIRASLGERESALYFPKGKVAWHGFRHLGATMVGRLTGDAFAVQRFLGDASPGMASCYMGDVRGHQVSVSQGQLVRELAKQRQVSSAVLLAQVGRERHKPPIVSGAAVVSGMVPAIPETVQPSNRAPELPTTQNMVTANKNLPPSSLKETQYDNL